MLDESADAGSSRLIILTGVGGIGKTMLALHWGHRSADRFPGGEIYIDLRGFGSSGAVMEPAEAVRQLLGSMGVEPPRIPADTDALLTLYRSIIGSERRLLVLDNARDAAQVRPLLPNSPQVHTVVISRHRLVGLAASHGAETIEIGAFDTGPNRPPCSNGSLGSAARSRTGIGGAGPGLLRGTAAGTRHRRRQGRDTVRPALGTIADELAASRLDALAVDEASMDLRAVFSWSYRSLEPDTARLFRLLAVIPGPDFSDAAAARLHGGTEAKAGRALRSLVEARLVEFGRPGRYRLHDLIRLYATELLDAEEPEPDRDAALDRLLDWYLRGAEGCRSALYPAMIGIPFPAVSGGRWQPTAEEAARWLEAEWENLIAAVEYAAERGKAPFTWLMADVTRGYAWLHMLGADGVRISSAALAAATGNGDPLGMAASALALACALIRSNRLYEAIDRARDAADFARLADWPAGEAAAEGNLSVACYYGGRMREGREHAFNALHAFRAIGEPRAEGTNLHWLGLFHYLLGELDTGIGYLEQAVKIASENGNDALRAVLLTHMAENQIHRGRLDLAADHLEKAAELERAAVSIDKTSDLLRTTARLRLAQGRIDEALEMAERVVEERTDDVDHRNRAAGIATLAAARDRAGEHDAAIALYDRVLAMTEHEATVFHRVEAMVNRSGALLRSGDAARAEAATREALKTARQGDYRFLEGQALNVLAEIDLQVGRLAEAADRAAEAMEIHRQTGHRAGEAASLQLLVDCTTDPETARTLRDQARALSPQAPQP